MAQDASSVDVLIVGAGPVGLITALQLARFGGISVRIIEKHAKSMQDFYGRAVTLFPRSSEMLDQLGLVEDLLQQCFACRDTVTYNSQGQEEEGRGWSFMNHMKDTAYDFSLVLRQKYSEEVFRKALRKLKLEVEAPVQLTAASVDKGAADGYRVTAEVLHTSTGKQETIKCKYLIGCDGGRSFVRNHFDIPFDGSSTEDKWVRIDGKVKTNMPKTRAYVSIESPTHGNVLWMAIDRGATRIGYAFTDAYTNKYEKFDEAAAVKEAIAAVKPFELEFERVDWWTIYTVGQRVARSFFVHDSVFLAGDACHTHSSGAAQGMNTGIHDSVNLGWKLSLVLRGLAKPEILQSYQAERLPNVQKLIQYDKDISRLMTNRLPENWQGEPDADVNDILGKIMAEAGTFSSGLGIYYDLSAGDTLSAQGSFVSQATSSPLIPGMRAPDVSLLRPGTFESTRLLRETPNFARFYVVIFEPKIQADRETAFSAAVQNSTLISKWRSQELIEFLVILPVKAPGIFEILDHEPLGPVFYDNEERSAFERYGINKEDGAVVVLRPDGWIGTMVSLQENSVTEIEEYMDRILMH